MSLVHCSCYHIQLKFVQLGLFLVLKLDKLEPFNFNEYELLPTPQVYLLFLMTMAIFLSVFSKFKSYLS